MRRRSKDLYPPTVAEMAALYAEIAKLWAAIAATNSRIAELARRGCPGEPQP